LYGEIDRKIEEEEKFGLIERGMVRISDQWLEKRTLSRRNRPKTKGRKKNLDQ
jgi:hypothetical protein